jgi:hypothetical protein
MFRFDDLGELAQPVRHRLSEVIPPFENQPAFGAFALEAGLDAVKIDFNSGLTPWTMKGNIGHWFLLVADSSVYSVGDD